MRVNGSSELLCSHNSHWFTFCPQESLSSRIAKVFIAALALYISYKVYYILNRSPSQPPSTPITQEKPIPPEIKSSQPSTDPTSLSVHPGAKATPQPQNETKETKAPPSRKKPSVPEIIPRQRIQTTKEIPQIPDMVGVRLAILQQRARPAAKGGETTRGFIKIQDSLLDVIQANWKGVESAQLSHADIAFHLHAIMKAAESSATVWYDPLTKRSATDITKKEKGMSCFLVTHINKKQDNRDTDIFRSESESKELGASQEEFLIQNTKVTGKSIRWTPIRFKYICEFGFYSLGMEIDTIIQVLYS